MSSSTMTNVGDDNRKPLVLAIAGAAVGHFTPVLHMCQHLINKGFDVSILQASYFKPQIEAIGATFIALDKECDWCQYDLALAGKPDGKFPERLKLAPGLETLAYDLEHIFMPYIPSQASSIRRALDVTQRRDPSRKLVMLAENSILGILPLKLVSDEKRALAPKILNVNVVPLTYESVDVGPFGTGLPPDSTPSGRLRNKMLHDLVRNFALKGALAALRKYLIEAGADPEHIPPPGELGFNIVYHPRVYERVFQMCIPEVELPRSDLPGHIEFVGGLPPKPVPKDYALPSWWTDITDNARMPEATRKKLVVVCQGTFATNYEHVILPTLEGLRDRSDVLVVAILGKAGAVLRSDFSIPSNARVSDFLLYDVVLPFADLWIQNGGYGGFQHGIANGVPTLLAGDTEDKPEVAARAEFSGVGLSLHTGKPKPEQIAHGVDEVLGNPKYKKRCEELKAVMEEYNSLGKIEQTLIDLAK
ncbi:MGT family Glycosyltransferase [Colletotrichum higginsianum]|uniref:MGT family Glycosyltransferase n=2 Tax=Colletotrichum higginsianum TaxID=80884 RepID=H1VDZ1_COLHI|nr:MGT family Glycosyltransferase [Colletotrichum higginsianum IMI 349063]OBR03098.1 MGT family Glycosyltransferase [Colletotrichum higginsianum IMI 349063]TIC91158.1 4'-demethylrebeccamycin synthase [Colletotrichum higginsianum]CCF38444.1 MGT family Glycosyltransferase [Colletotrichum higginsianum]